MLLVYAVVSVTVGKVCFGSKHLLVGLYCGWAVGESLLGAGIGIGLQFASTWLLAGDDGGIASSWMWFWRLVQINTIMSVAALLVQIVIFVLLVRNRNYGSFTAMLTGRPAVNMHYTGVGAARESEGVDSIDR